MSVINASEYVAANAAILGTVPSVPHAGVCRVCLGQMRGDWEYCYSCKQILEASPHRGALEACLIAATAARQDRAWYAHLAQYKTTQAEKGELVAAVLAAYFHAHRERFAGMLGGPPSLVTCVPSKRYADAEQRPLTKLIRRIVDLRDRFHPALTYVGNGAWQRQKYQAGHFTVDALRVFDERVLLIEDTVVTGATCFSAAGALLDAGAASVAILAAARSINPSYWPDGPYLVAMEAPYRLDHWCRP